MPSLLHNALAELLRNNPRLAAALVLDQNIELSAHPVAQQCLHNDPGSTATVVDSNFSVVDPFDGSKEVEFDVDAAVLLESRMGRLLVVLEPQTDPPKPAKRRAWPAYVGIGQSRFQCDTALVVIALSRTTADSCRKSCLTGHRGFRLYPIVRGPDCMPDPDDPCMAQVRVELTVLSAVTRSLDLDHPAIQRKTLDILASANDQYRAIYTHYIRIAASEAARNSLEELMASPTYKDDFIENFWAQGHAEGQAEGRTEGVIQGQAAALLDLLEDRGFSVSDSVRELVLSCTDRAQIRKWSKAAMREDTIEAVFR